MTEYAIVDLRGLMRNAGNWYVHSFNRLPRVIVVDKNTIVD